MYKKTNHLFRKVSLKITAKRVHLLYIIYRGNSWTHKHKYLKYYILYIICINGQRAGLRQDDRLFKIGPYFIL